MLLLTILAVFFFILPEVELIERLDLPDNLGDELDDVGGTVLGLISIGILGPIAEELLFRGAVLGSLLQWRPIRSMPWIAILLSAALFGLVHMNPAQMPGAIAIGLPDRQSAPRHHRPHLQQLSGLHSRNVPGGGRQSRNGRRNV